MNTIIPINKDKTPAVKEWQVPRTHDLSGAYGIGLVCGKASGNIEVIDVDLKYDLTGTLMQRFKELVNQSDSELLKQLTVQKTISGGFHLIYKCETIEGNKKLAERPLTETEKVEGEKHGRRVLFETRGEGGYIVIAPTKGYKIIQGDINNINLITPEKREILLSAARSFNEVYKESAPQRKLNSVGIKGLSPLDDFNARSDVRILLEKHGWVFVNAKGAKDFYKRPGSTTALTSGNYDHEKKWFSVFTTSSVFDPQTSYSPAAIYATLECDGDFNEAARKLYHEGYGERIEAKTTNPNDTKSRISLADNDLSFLATPEHYSQYLKQLRDGTFPMGLSTGLEDLDVYFRYKRGNLVIINGHDNVGKTAMIWFLALISSMLHGWKWIIFSSENSVGSFYRTMIEFYWTDFINNIPKEKELQALEFINEHFSVILSDDCLYNYKDILNMTTKIIKNKKHDALLIDPYNSLDIELNDKSKLSTHEYHYKAISEIKLFGRQNDVSIYVNCHAVTNALREKDKDGYSAAPRKADTEGGGKFSNKADEFITIHRKIDDPNNWMVSELHIRKVKETQTGGKVTPILAPIKLWSERGVVGFKNEHGVNPVYKHQNKIVMEEINSTNIKPNTEFELKPPKKEPVRNFYEVDSSDVPEFLKDELDF